jgi:hypothetical protein
MRANLMLFSCAALIALLGVSVWATSKISIVPAIQALMADPAGGTNPWFIATTFDAYFGFLWFWAWIAYKETSTLARGAWLVGILALGNIAMAGYMLLQLRKLPAGAPAQALLLRSAA